MHSKFNKIFNLLSLYKIVSSTYKYVSLYSLLRSTISKNKNE